MGCVHQRSGSPHPLLLVPQRSIVAHLAVAVLCLPSALDLSSIATSLPFTDFSSKAFTSELWTALHEVAPSVVSVNLSNNHLSSLSSFTRLHACAPALINLSLAHNALDKMEQLEHLSAFRDQLNELILTGNPLHPSSSSSSSASSASQPASTSALDPLLYSHLVSSLFPNLKLLDNAALTQIISFDLPPIISTSALPPTLGSFFDQPKNMELVRAFVDKFFACLDSSSTERQKLVSVYTDDAHFSLALPMPDGAQTTLVSPVYSSLNRNALQLHKANGKQQATASASLLKTGPVTIVYALSQLPPSQHHIDGFVADVMLVPSAAALLFVTVRGTLLETDTRTLRAFHRVFLLTAPGADALSKGWAVSIVNDQLLLGASKIQQQQLPALGLSHSTSLQSLSPLPPALSPSPGVDLQSVVLQLSMQTGVDQATALQVLQQSQGNAEQAFLTIQSILQQQQLQLG